MDRDLLADVAARLDELTDAGAGASLEGWQDLWRTVVPAGAPAGPAGPAGPAPATVGACVAAVEEALGRPGRRLVTYGTLRPGEVNHHLLAGMGRWRPGRVRGRLGEWCGYPVLRPDPGGPEVAVMVLEAAGLRGRLADLDRFEGPAYRRRRIVVDLDPQPGPAGPAGPAGERGSPGPGAPPPAPGSGSGSGSGSAEAVVAWCYVDAGAAE